MTSLQKESEWEKPDTRTHLENSLVDVAVAGEKGFSDNIEKAMENHLDRCMEEISLAVSNREKEIAEEVKFLKEVCTECQNREIHDTDRNKVLDEVLSILKH